jgi:tetratricopeptide (TPR) repeat protein
VLVDDDVRDQAERAVRRGSAPRRRGEASSGASLDDDVRAQVAKSTDPARRERVERRLKEAGKAFQADRFGDAARILKPLAQQAPSLAPVRELYGLTLYRQGKWRPAIAELEAFRSLTGSTEQNPVLADCHRALGHYDEVGELWDELRQASPSAELVTEGRIVAAGALADQGRTRPAIQLLEKDWRFPKRPKEHHLRRAYALADLYERAGELPRARDLFQRVAAADPEFADAGQRARALR